MNKYYSQHYFKERDFLIPHLAEAIRHFMREHKLTTALDVGCGTGRLVEFLNNKRFQALGCDNAKDAVREAKKISGKTKIFHCSATKLPFKQASFDLVVAISVVEHLTYKQSESFIREAKRILKPGGYIFLVTPNLLTPIRSLQGKDWFGYSDPTHINFYTPNSLAKELKEFGFKNSKFIFKFKYVKSVLWEFPHIYAKLPKFVKYILIYLLFSTPLYIIRNSFWITAQKSDLESADD